LVFVLEFRININVDAIPHILCGGFTKEDTENLLIDLDFLGIDNVVALRGDALKNETYFKPEKEGNEYATDLGVANQQFEQRNLFR
jgi:methylenetetrahydrofolate reductase (NADPH)